MAYKFLIIPGNPNAQYFYENWANSLVRNIKNSNYRIFPPLSFPVTAPELCEKEHKNLNSTIKYYKNSVAEEIRNTKNRSSNEKIILIGHSIGGFFASHIYQDYSPEIDQAILIYPYFGEHNLMGTGLLNFCNTVSYKESIGNFVANSLLAFNKIIPDYKYIKTEELVQGARLAKLELFHFKEKINKKIPESCLTNEKVHFLYNNKDNWCTQKTINRFPKNRSSQCQTRHDFVLNNREIDIINKKIKSLLIKEN